MDVRTIHFGPAPQVVKGTLTAVGDTVAIPILGAGWATVKFNVIAGGTAIIVAEVSIDGGTNFFSSAYAKKLSTAAANPQVVLIAGALSTGDVWEIPIPANTTHFRLRATVGGTASTLIVSPSQAYVPGMPVTAVLYDVTSGTNAALDTGTIDSSGWSAFTHLMTMSGGTPAFSLQEVDDAGTSSANLLTWAVATYGGLGGAAANPGTGVTAGLAGTSNVTLSKRVRYQSAAIAAQTSRMRIVARR